MVTESDSARVTDSPGKGRWFDRVVSEILDQQRTARLFGRTKQRFIGEQKSSGDILHMDG